VTGGTTSLNFPTNNALYPNFGGGAFSSQRDVFVAKIGANGTNLLFSTYLGGNGDDGGYGLVLDGAGNIHLTGVTASPNFPVTTNAVAKNIHGTLNLGVYPYDVFVVKLNPSG